MSSPMYPFHERVGAAHGRRLILLVDDDARTARRMAQMLREDGYDVEIAADGAAAIARLCEVPEPDVLVTDLRMPLGDGMSVTRFSRARRPGLPIFVVTGYPNLMPSEGSLGQPAPIVFTKPVDYVQLRDRIAATLGAPPGAG